MAFASSVRRNALESLRGRLLSVDSGLAYEPEAIEYVLREADAALGDVATAISSGELGERRSTKLGFEVGVTPAEYRLHPVDSLSTAVTMFEVLLPIVVDAAQHEVGTDEAPLLAAARLHEAVVERVGLRTASYIGHLLEQIDSSYRDERCRISRELHDGAAHTMGTALQDLELYEYHVGHDSQRARRWLASARSALHEGLEAVNYLSRNLRKPRTVVDSLTEMLSAYLSSRVPTHLDTRVSVIGEEHLPDAVRDELFCVLREAVRNAVLHADARALEVVVEVSEHKAEATVRDDGRGFDVTKALGSPASLGLLSMRDRLDLYGGTLNIVSLPGSGTTISMSLGHSGTGT